MDQNVFPLQVTVNDTMLMRVPEGARHRDGNPYGLLDGKLLLAIDARAESLPGHERHHVVQKPAGVAAVEEWEKIRVLEVRRYANLGKEPLRTEDRAELWLQDFEGDFALVS